MNESLWNPSVITAMTSVVMVLIWISHLQLALTQYRRASRPFLIIQHAHESAPSAVCMFVNMSQEPVHIECVLTRVTTRRESFTRYIVDYQRMTPEDRDVRTRLRQGPIQPGGYLVLGSFAEIILGVRTREAPDDDEEKLLTDLREIEQLRAKCQSKGVTFFVARCQKCQSKGVTP